MHLPFGCCACLPYAVKITLEVCMLVGMVVWAKPDSYVFRIISRWLFFVVGESASFFFVICSRAVC